MPPLSPAAFRRSIARRAASSGGAEATPTASSPAASPVARTASVSSRSIGPTVGSRRAATSAGARAVLERREEADPAEQPHGPLLGDVDDHGIAGIAVTDERDDAVVTGVASLHRALVTADRHGHLPIITR